MTTEVAPDMLATAQSLQSTVRDFADETERGRMCPPKLVEILHENRMFDMILPVKYGGLECDVLTLVRVLEELAIADASTAWAVGIGCGTSIVAAHMPEAAVIHWTSPGPMTPPLPVESRCATLP